MDDKLRVETSDPADIVLIKSLLDAEVTLCFVHGEALSAVPRMVESVRFMVAEDRLKDARKPIRGLHLPYEPRASATKREPDEEPSDD